MARVRTRIAPSPTGIPHIGTARTSLYNYLLAKKYGGDFILRLEDTDRKRFVPESVGAINEIHRFLGLIPDESYVQTERLKFYQKYAKELVKLGAAYEDEGAVRVKMPDTGQTRWTDLVQGEISFPNEEVDDKVLLKSDGIPTYHLAVVVDDHLMEISHVIRGVEWISSTPVHLFLYRALGWQPPVLAHVPLILGPDKTKLSKRHGAKSALQYGDEGYLPEAINNYVFYLGFSYKDNGEILTLSEMIRIFDEKKLSKHNPIFDIEKLNWFNGQWIRRQTDARLIELVKPGLELFVDNEQLMRIMPLCKERMTTLKDFNRLTRFFFETPNFPVEEAGLKQYLAGVAAALEQAEWNKEKIEAELLKLVEERRYPKGDFFMALRLAVTGQRISPPLTESMLILGREKVLERIKQAG